MNEGQSSKKEQNGDFRRGGGRKRRWPRSRPSPGRLPGAAHREDARGPPRPSPPPQAGQPPGSRQAPGRRGWDRRSPRLRARRRDPGGKALRVRHFGCLCRSVQLPREPPTETRGGREAAAALSEKGKKTTRRRRCPGRATRRHPRPGGGGGSGHSGLKWLGIGGGRTNRLTEPGGGGSLGRSRNDAGREPPAQGERAFQADLGKCEAPGKTRGGFRRQPGLSARASARRAPSHPRPGPRLRSTREAECTPPSPPCGSHSGPRAWDHRLPPPVPALPRPWFRTRPRPPGF